MNREIKFRIFHKGGSTDRINIDGYERIGKDGWEWMCLELNSDKGERWCSGVYPSSEKYIRAQFTGLKDKDGKEIYEGDILNIEAVSRSGEVKYESDHAGFIVQWEYSKNQHHISLDCDIAFNAEIKGNIYENKHLKI